MKLIASSLVSLAALAIAQPGSAQDLFPDKNLEAVVRQYVFEKKNKPDPLVEADVVNISGIKADGNKVAKITNLAGLEKCKSLASIELPNHEIADLAPLKELKQLQSVILNKNKIASVAPLADLTGIQLLWIQDNQIADVAPLAKIAAMGSLDLSNNQIKDRPAGRAEEDPRPLPGEQPNREFCSAGLAEEAGAARSARDWDQRPVAAGRADRVAVPVPARQQDHRPVAPGRRRQERL
jgi:Leucine-rich repeat (LRR) protein